MNMEQDPGRLLARGVMRHLMHHGFVTMEQFVPSPGLRVDVMALGPKGEFWIIECKSGLADFRSDAKWHRYLKFCDQFLWAVDTAFPIDVLPPDTGLIISDGFDASIERCAPDIPSNPLHASRRKALTLRFARTAAQRLRIVHDPPSVRRFAPEGIHDLYPEEAGRRNPVSTQALSRAE